MKKNKPNWKLWLTFLFIVTIFLGLMDSSLAWEHTVYDDFETGDVNAARWTNGGSPIAQDNFPYNGTYVANTENGDDSLSKDLSLTMGTSGKYVLEFYVRQFSAPANTVGQPAVYNDGGTYCVQFNVNYPTTGVWGFDDGSWRNFNVSSTSGDGDTTGQYARVRILANNDNGLFSVRFGNATTDTVTDNPYNGGCNDIQEIKLEPTTGNFSWDLVHVWNYTEYGWDWPPAAATPNFTIQVTDRYDATTVMNFNATVNGTFYETTTGTIVTNISSDATDSLFNVSISANNYFDKTYIDYNASSDIAAQMHQAEYRMSATEIISNSSVSGGNFSIGSQENDTVLYLKAGTYNITWQKANWYNKTQEFVITAGSNTTATVTGVYETRLNITVKDYLNTSISTFTATVELVNGTYSGYTATNSTTNGYLYFPAIYGRYNITVDAKDYAYGYKQANLSETHMDVNLSVFTTNSIAFMFYDEETENIIDYETITTEIISDDYSASHSTTNGTLYVDLLAPDSYTIRFDAPSYDQRLYYFTLTNRTHTNLSLYLVNSTSSTAVTATVYDQEGDQVESAVIKVLKYDVDTNSYTIKEMSATNVNGQSVLNLVLNTEFYKFIIEYPSGTVVQETTPSYVFSNTITFQISTGSKAGERFFTVNDISYDLTFNNYTNSFYLTYSDSSGTVSQACLYIYTWHSSGQSLYSTNCTTGSAASFWAAVQPENGTTYKAVAYAFFGSDQHHIDTLLKSYDEQITTAQLGLFLALIMVLTTITIMTKKTQLAAIFVPLTLLGAKTMGIVDISNWVVFPIMVGGLLLAAILGKS